MFSIVLLSPTDQGETGSTDPEHTENQQTKAPGEEEEASPAEYAFCQICQKDLSHMNSPRRTLHINRGMDQVSDTDSVMIRWLLVVVRGVISQGFC